MDVLESIGQPGAEPPDGDDTVDGDDQTIDGRSLRRQRNRDAVVEAAFALIRERRSTPTIDEVAERSGLSARSVFRYFDDTDDLISAVIERQRRHLTPLWEPRTRVSDPLDVRIDRFVSGRLTFVEAQGGVAWVARVRANDQPLIRTELNRARAGLRLQVEALFAPELAALGDAGPAVCAAIDTLTSWEADDLLRRGHGAGRAAVADMMATSIRRLLAPPTDGEATTARAATTTDGDGDGHGDGDGSGDAAAGSGSGSGSSSWPDTDR